jgi:hypothetical protein
MKIVDAQRQDWPVDQFVTEVHALRERQWAKYGDDSQAWFDDLLRHQAQRNKLIQLDESREG